MNTIGHSFPIKDIFNLLQAAPKDSDGSITYSQFIDWLFSAEATKFEQATSALCSLVSLGLYECLGKYMGQKIFIQYSCSVVRLTPPTRWTVSSSVRIKSVMIFDVC